mgnify:CR=1 FL=1
MSAMPDDTTAYYAALVREPCLLAEDLVAIALEEPDVWARFASTAEHSMAKADWSLPFLVIRTHTEVVDEAELLFVLRSEEHTSDTPVTATSRMPSSA